METVVSLALIRLLTAGPIRDSGAPNASSLDLFVYSPSRPFSAPRGWAAWALGGVLLSPLVVGSMAALLSATGYEGAVGGGGTVDGVAAMIDLDLPTYLSLLAVTGVLAPVLEVGYMRGDPGDVCTLPARALAISHGRKRLRGRLFAGGCG